MEITSKRAALNAISLALTETREDETLFINNLDEMKAVAVDIGGEFIPSVSKIIERAVVACRRQGVIDDSHKEEGAVVGATREAINQVMQKAIGLNVGGKIAICRGGDHICVALFLTIGFLNLNEISIGLGHRVI